VHGNKPFLEFASAALEVIVAWGQADTGSAQVGVRGASERIADAPRPL